jgi:hypothetical protein
MLNTTQTPNEKAILTALIIDELNHSLGLIQNHHALTGQVVYIVQAPQKGFAKIYNFLVELPDGTLVMIPRKYLKQTGRPYSEDYRRTLHANKELTWEAPIDNTVDDFNPDSVYFQNELPTNRAFYVMGLTDLENEHLDTNDQADTFRNYCIQQSGANYFLHQKNLTDLRSIPEHHNPEKLSAKLDIPYNVAYRLADAFKALEIDRKAYLKIMKGNATKTGLEKATPVQKIKSIELLTKTAEELEDVTVRWENYTSGNPDSKPVDHYSRHIQNTEIFEDGDTFGEANPFGANRLFSETETLSYDFQVKIQTADAKTLKVECQKMFAQKNKYGRFQRREYYYFTPGMKSHFWALYKARKVALRYPNFSIVAWTADPKQHERDLIAQENLPAPVEDLSTEAKIAYDWITSLAGHSGNIATAIINAGRQGNAYNLYGIEINFKSKLTTPEINCLIKAA